MPVAGAGVPRPVRRRRAAGARRPCGAGRRRRLAVGGLGGEERALRRLLERRRRRRRSRRGAVSQETSSFSSSKIGRPGLGGLLDRARAPRAGVGPVGSRAAVARRLGCRASGVATGAGPSVRARSGHRLAARARRRVGGSGAGVRPRTGRRGSGGSVAVRGAHRRRRHGQSGGVADELARSDRRRGRRPPGRAAPATEAYGLTTWSHSVSSGRGIAGPDLARAQHAAVLVRAPAARPSGETPGHRPVSAA